jgi:hypothetical protein
MQGLYLFSWKIEKSYFFNFFHGKFTMEIFLMS